MKLLKHQPTSLNFWQLVLETAMDPLTGTEWICPAFLQSDRPRWGEPYDHPECGHRVRPHAAAPWNRDLELGGPHGLSKPDSGANTAGVWEYFWQVDGDATGRSSFPPIAPSYPHRKAAFFISDPPGFSTIAWPKAKKYINLRWNQVATEHLGFSCSCICAILLQRQCPPVPTLDS